MNISVVSEPYWRVKAWSNGAAATGSVTDLALLVHQELHRRAQGRRNADDAYDALVSWSKVSQARGDHQESRARADEALLLLPDRPEARSLRARAHRELTGIGKLARASEALVTTWDDSGGWSGRREAPGVARRSRLSLVSSHPPSNRACGSPAHGSPTFFTVGIQRPARHGRLGRGATMVPLRLIRP